MASEDGVVDLGQGWPDFGASIAAREGAARAMLGDGVRANQYAPVRGDARMVAALIRYYAATGFDVGRCERGTVAREECVVVTASATEAIYGAFQAATRGGGDGTSRREIVFVEPFFPWYKAIADDVGAVSVVVRARAEDGFRVDVDAVRAACSRDRTALLVMCSPHNPTGHVMTQDELEGIASAGRGLRFDRIERRSVRAVGVRRSRVHAPRHRGRHERAHRHDWFGEQAFKLDGLARRLGRGAETSRRPNEIGAQSDVIQRAEPSTDWRRRGARGDFAKRRRRLRLERRKRRRHVRKRQRARARPLRRRPPLFLSSGRILLGLRRRRNRFFRHGILPRARRSRQGVRRPHVRLLPPLPDRRRPAPSRSLRHLQSPIHRPRGVRAHSRARAVRSAVVVYRTYVLASEFETRRAAARETLNFCRGHVIATSRAHSTSLLDAFAVARDGDDRARRAHRSPRAARSRPRAARASSRRRRRRRRRRRASRVANATRGTDSPRRRKARRRATRRAR